MIFENGCCFYAFRSLSKYIQILSRIKRTLTNKNSQIEAPLSLATVQKLIQESLHFYPIIIIRFALLPGHIIKILITKLVLENYFGASRETTGTGNKVELQRTAT